MSNKLKQAAAGSLPDESWWSSILTDGEAGGAGLSTEDQYILVIDWDWVLKQYQDDQILVLTVTGHNRGGLLVENSHIRGFVPLSHLVDLPEKNPHTQFNHNLDAYLGRSLDLKIIECCAENERIVLSERAALSAPGQRLELLESLTTGSIVPGQVSTVTKFGAFVDLGGVEGLIHISELSWGRVAHPSEILSPGDQIEVYIVDLDIERCRVALSTKRLLPNPWDTVDEHYHPDAVVDAVITSIVGYGAFARLHAGLDGLIHISEFEGHPQHPGDVVTVGQQVEVRILHIDTNRQQLGLRLHTVKDELI
ncbi:MAG: S1 RNA-binding domain-containing protein [Chloroflexota bacterium]